MWYVRLLLVFAVLAGLAVALKSKERRSIDWENLKFIDSFPRQFLGNSSPKSTYTEEKPGDRIVGGEIAPTGRFPYQVGLLNDFGQWCGASLISSTYVLTAARCIAYQPDYVLLYLAAHNIRDPNEERMEVVVHGDFVKVHPEWDYSFELHDIGLIELPEPLNFTDLIQPISLPSRSEALLGLEEKQVIATGWGYATNDADGLSPSLRLVRLKVMPPTICKHFWLGLIQGTHVCTDTGRGEGTCIGDSGGPLAYYRQDGTPIIVGLTSFVSPIGCDVGWPSVYTRVGKYLDWISANTGIKIED